MLKYLVLACIFLGLARASLPIYCGSDRSFSCQSNQTCCRGPSGWRCCAGLSAICCSDGASCCPSNTICDLKNRRCNPKPMFLSMLEDKNVEVTLSIPPVFSNTTMDFIEGFVNGTNLLAAIPDVKTCGHIEPETQTAVQELVDLVKSLNATNWEERIPLVLNQTIQVYHALLKEGKQCQRGIEEVLALGERLRNHVTRSGYLNDIITHATTTIFDVVLKIKNVQDALNSGNHFNAGMHTGLLSVHLFFWDLK